jgi:hypothetical protein
VPFAVEVIMLMCWSIWTEKNFWLFTNEDPSVNKCLETFKREFSLVIHKAKKKRYVLQMEVWIQNVVYISLVPCFSVLCFLVQFVSFIINI